MPTILDCLGGTIPPATDGMSLMPVLAAPGITRDALHYEYDFRDIFYSAPERDLGLHHDNSSLCVIQDARFKYVHFAALPPLLFDLHADPHQFQNLAANPAHTATVRDYAQRMLSWRMCHADRTLTHLRASPAGLQSRLSEGPTP